MTAYTRPIVIGHSSEATCLLDRVPLEAGAGQISERWLQEALFAHPECLPVREIDPSIGALVPVCMEIETGAGPADILYVTPTGQIVLVETKLWRNPEARRQVVGQLLDYAKQLTGWSYDVLDEKAALAAKTSSGHLLRCLKSRYPEVDEAAFVDGVSRNLQSAEFLLLIVGDGIRSGAESLVGFLERYGHLKFGLGLIEVAAFRLPDGGMLLQPRILARTEILQRTILIGPSGPIKFQEAAAEDDDTTSEDIQSQRDRFRAFWSEYLAALRQLDPALADAEPAKSTNQFFPMPPYGGAAWISAFIAQSSGTAGVYLTFAKNFAAAPELARKFEDDRESIIQELGADLLINAVGDKVYIGVPKVFFEDLAGADRRRVIDYLADKTRRMVVAFKPRLENALAESD
jgi:hypothetical protein